MFDWDIIDQKKILLDARRPFPPHTVKSLREKMLVEWTYHSNAIEGNTLTLKETRVVLEGITIGGKSVKEHLEALNHKDAILYLDTVIEEKEPLSEWQVKNIHAIVLKNIEPENAGLYRKENVVIAGAKHIPPDFIIVPDRMQDLIVKYETEWESLHPAERSAMLHVEFVGIHPFVDGNGRTARLLQNFELMKNGFPPIVIQKEQRLEYYEYLDKAHTTGDVSGFVGFTAQRVEEALDFYLQVIGG